MPRSEFQRYYLQAMAIDLYASKVVDNAKIDANSDSSPNTVAAATRKSVQHPEMAPVKPEVPLSLADLTQNNLVVDVCYLLALAPEQIKKTSARTFLLGDMQWLISSHNDAEIDYQSGQLVTGPLETLHSVTRKRQLWLALGSRLTKAK